MLAYLTYTDIFVVCSPTSAVYDNHYSSKMVEMNDNLIHQSNE